MNWAARALIGLALFAGCAAIISLQQGELVLTLNGYQMRSSAPATIALFIFYTLVVVALTRLALYLFGIPARRRQRQQAEQSSANASSTEIPEDGSFRPYFVNFPRPLDAAPPLDDHQK